MGYVTSAIEHIGLTKLGNRLNYWPSAIQKWAKADRLPRTELMGITDYSSIVAEMAEEARIQKGIKDEKYTAKRIREYTRERWQEKEQQRANA